MFFKIIFSISIALVFTACSNNKKLPEKCFKKGSTGMCRGYFTKYHFNMENEKCEKYIYGGCGEVVFHTLKECQKACEK